MKSQVYSWRLDLRLKQALEEQARERGRSLSSLLDQITREWLKREQVEDDEEIQNRLHDAARRSIGKLRPRDPDFASSVSERMRSKLGSRHESNRPG